MSWAILNILKFCTSSNHVTHIFFSLQTTSMCDGALNCRDSSTDCLRYYKSNRMDEVLIFVCQNEKGRYFYRSLSGYQILFHLITFLKLLMHKQNPENYAVKKGTSSDRIERHMQGNVIFHWYNYYFPLSPLIINVILCQRFASRKLMS